MSTQLTDTTHRLRAGIFTLTLTVATLAAVADAPRVTRADLGWSLLELEQAMAARDLNGLTVRQVNRRFDAAVSYFFTNRYSEAVELINGITQELLPPEQRSPMLDWLKSVAVEIEPRAHVAGQPGDAGVTIRSLYEPPPFPLNEGTIELRLLDDTDTRAWYTRLDLAEYVDDGLINVRLALNESFQDLPAGTYRIELAAPESPGVRYQRIFILPRPVDDMRRDLLETINGLDEANGSLTRAIRIARARAALLKQRPSPLNSAEFLADLHGLLRELESEVGTLQHGGDPYINREGDLWRPVATRPVQWPMRVYAPAGLESEEPLPLIIALHGAGGDENMFHDSYGNGAIQRLADEHRFIVASPVTYPLGGDMNLLGELIEEMQRCYPIDIDRVYLIGHSLGAGTVSAALLSMPERIAAASCIAGAGRFANERDDRPYPPVLVIGADRDFVVPAARVQQLAEAGMERGLPIEYRLAEDWGHVLVVGGVLEEVILWLLDHKREATRAEKGPGDGD